MHLVQQQVINLLPLVVFMNHYTCRSNRANLLQLFMSIMLIARATNKQVKLTCKAILICNIRYNARLF